MEKVTSLPVLGFRPTLFSPIVEKCKSLNDDRLRRIVTSGVWTVGDCRRCVTADLRRPSSCVGISSCDGDLQRQHGSMSARDVQIAQM